MIPQACQDALHAFAESRGRITFLTGAGISAESGVPTFRGPEGYWTVGSREYQPEEMATQRMFSVFPELVWQWYLYRLGVCRRATPNSGHLALSRLEQHLQDRFTLITQNVDGLHHRAGNTPARTLEIHGNVSLMRCSNECTASRWPIPEQLFGWERDRPFDEETRQCLRCPHCGDFTRPHVLWFDEYYDEVNFRAMSALQVARKTELLVIIGTSGTTNLPWQITESVVHRGNCVLDINLHDNPFQQVAEQHGWHLRSSASVLQQVADLLGCQTR